MNEAAGDIKNRKRRGEWAELRFMAEAAQRGLSVSKPWGESDRYDVGVEHNGHYQRVQVKSTLYRIKAYYRCNLKTWNRNNPYRPGEVDFFAIYIIPEDLWYIVPAAVALAIKGKNIGFTPHLRGHKYECYQKAWHLLSGPEPV
ncbi:MAG: group I intron-associated PD-(D/E)XK endonuclease [Terriglobales bacterium]